MKHEFGKRYPTSDVPASDEYPVVVFYTLGSPTVIHHAASFFPTSMNDTWQRLEQFPMADPAMFKPKWAKTIKIDGTGNCKWVTADGPMGQYATGRSCPTEREAIEVWNAMWEQE